MTMKNAQKILASRNPLSSQVISNLAACSSKQCIVLLESRNPLSSQVISNWIVQQAYSLSDSRNPLSSQVISNPKNPTKREREAES